VAFGIVDKQRVESVVYNTAVLIDPQDEVNTTYRQVHLRGEERLAFRPSRSRFAVSETAFGVVGLL